MSLGGYAIARARCPLRRGGASLLGASRRARRSPGR
nr:MAG TPA: hypothetical protein [Caudoviricetes sp.]